MGMMANLAGRATWADSFQYRDFRLLWGSTLLQSIGMGMEFVALGYLVLNETNSPFMVGAAAAARMAPLFLLGMVSGAVADRVDRRLFLRFVNLVGGVVAGLMAVALITDVADVWHIMVFAFASGGIWAFNLTVRQAYTYDIVGPERALNGLSLNALSQQIGGVAGSIIAGMIISTVSVGAQYLAVSASYLSSIVFLLALRDVGQAAVTRRQPVLDNLVGYVQILKKNTTLRTLMVLTAVTEVFGFTHMSLLPVFARDVLGVGALGLGFMTAVRQAGGMLGLVLLASLGDFKRKGLLIFAVAAAFGLGQMAFSLPVNLFAFLVVLVVVNACAHSVDTLYKTLMQDNVANDERGRAMGSWVFSIGTAPIGHLGVGGMASAFGAPGALLINGSILAFVSVAAAVGLPKIRRLE